MFLEEPVDLWRELKLLQRMYDGSLSPLEFQLVALSTGFGGLAPLLYRRDVRLIITERSPFSDKHVFAKTTIGNEEENQRDAYQAYSAAYDQLIQIVPSHVDVVHVMLHAPTSVVLERIGKRDRPEEREIKESYLEKLDNAHSEWLKSVPASSVEHVDCARSADDIAQDVLAIIERRSGFGPAPVVACAK